MAILEQIRSSVWALARAPGFTAVAIATLAIAIGVNTGMFSIVEAVLLRPLPYPDSARLMRVTQVNSQSGAGASASYPDFLDWQKQSTSFTHLAAYEEKAFDLTGGREPRQLAGAFVSPEFFEVFGVATQLGQTLALKGNPNRAVLSYRVFARDFAADANIIGKPCWLDGEPYTVVGVMPPEFDYPKDAELWVSASSNRADIQELTRSRGSRGFSVIGRLKRHVDLDRARTEVHTIAERLTIEYPEDREQDARVTPLRSDLAGQVRPSLLMLMGSVGLVLLIACANLGNLMLARSSARLQELAIRASLGAGRARIIQQVLTESILLSLTGGVLGALLALVSLKTIISLAPADLPRIQSVQINPAVLAFSAAVSIFSGIACSLAPAWQVGRHDLNLLVHESGRGSTGRSPLRSGLVVAEISLSLMVLAGAGLLMKSLLLAENVDPGFRADHLLTVQVYRPISPTEGGVAQGMALEMQWSSFYQQLTRNIERLPGVESAGATLRLPLQGRRWISGFTVAGRSASTPLQTLEADTRIVSNNYFQVLQIPLKLGRYFSAADAKHSPPVAVVNEAVAQRAFPGEDPIGQVLATTSFSAGSRRIIGVVANTHQTSVQEEPAPEVYFPYTQVSMPWQTIVVRAKSDPMSLLPAIQRVVAGIDPNQSLGRVETMDHLVNASLGQPRFRTALLGSFAALAFLLAIIGIYAVMEYSLSRRTREIGIRMALGAQRKDARRLMIREALRLIIVGLVLGTAGAIALSGLLANMLYGTSTSDPWVFGAVALVLGLTALLASYLPARRAASVDPTVALRYE